MLSIETPRLIIRTMQIEDAPFFDAYKTHPDFLRFKTSEPDLNYDFVAGIEKKLERAAQHPPRYWPLAVVLKENDHTIGDIRIFSDEGHETMAEMAYGLNPDYWRRGLMSEAVRHAVNHCHEILRIHRVVIRADAENVASWRVAEKIGMAYEGSTRYGFKTWKGYLPELKIYASVRPDLMRQ